MRKRWILWFMLAPVIVWLAVAPADADEFDGLREKIPQEILRRGVPSVAVAVARDGRVLWEQGFGWADRENLVPATEHTMYSLASISKPITATAIALLVERGKLDLDKPINDYLGEAKLVARVGDAKDATLRRVANHSAGLPLHYQFFYADQPYRRPPMDETIRRYGNLVTAPGERFQYSNLGYGILDYLIARTSGQSYADFMREEVFLPLGLTHMSVDIGSGLQKFEAARYAPDGWRIPFYDFDHPGGSAVFASAHDLVRFGMFHIGDRLPEQKEILSEDMRRKMQEPTAEIAKDRGYGLGWFVDRDAAGNALVSHSGGMGGVSTLLTLVPAKRVVVVALANAGSPLPAALSKEILEIVNPPADSGKREAEGTLTFQAPAEADAIKTLAGRWEGIVHTYERDLPITLRVQEDGDVHVQIEGQLATLLTSPRYRDGWLRGRFAGNLHTEDTARMPYDLHLEVKHREDVLNGSLTAISHPSRRTGNALTHWIEVRRAKE